MTADEKVVNVRVAMPESLHEAVKREADKQDRTMASFIRHTLRDATGTFGDRSR